MCVSRGSPHPNAEDGLRKKMMVLALLLTAPAHLSAQDRPGVEVGMRAGVNVLLNGADLVAVGVPGGGPAGIGSLAGGSATAHAAFFPSDRIMLEPQLSFSILDLSNGDSQTVTNLALTGQAAYLLSGASTNSPYIGVSGSFIWTDIVEGTNEFTSTNGALGGSVGYRFLPIDNVALRVEGAYRRWFDNERHELTGAFIVGILLR